jgi:hypothetical protein
MSLILKSLVIIGALLVFSLIAPFPGMKGSPELEELADPLES